MKKPNIHRKTVKIEIDEWDYSCFDGCCFDYGTTVKINGHQLDPNTLEIKDFIAETLRHLGYEVELIETYNGENQ